MKMTWEMSTKQRSKDWALEALQSLEVKRKQQKSLEKSVKGRSERRILEVRGKKGFKEGGRNQLCQMLI